MQGLRPRLLNQPAPPCFHESPLAPCARCSLCSAGSLSLLRGRAAYSPGVEASGWQWGPESLKTTDAPSLGLGSEKWLTALAGPAALTSG